MDTALTQQGTWLNYTGRTLRAHERDTVIVHTLFPRSGAHLLSVSPDGEQLTFSLPIDIGNRGTKDIISEQPQVSFLDPHTAVITQRYANPHANKRAAETFIYDLLDDSTGLSARIDHYLYLTPQTDTTETVRFSALRPGASYTFRLRKSLGRCTNAFVPNAFDIGYKLRDEGEFDRSSMVHPRRTKHFETSRTRRIFATRTRRHSKDLLQVVEGEACQNSSICTEESLRPLTCIHVKQQAYE